MNRGESLIEALENEKQVLPPLYRAVVEAGGAVRPVADRARRPGAVCPRLFRGQDLDRSALWYPLVVLSLAYALFVGLVVAIVPRFLDAFDSLGLASPAPMLWLRSLGQTTDYWWLAGPIVLAVLAFAWRRLGTAARFQSASWTWLKLFPWMRSILASYEGANFCELLALLLEHQVTYPLALKLAAEATGNPRMVRGARAGGGDQWRRGRASVLEKIDRKAFLPMLRWVLATGQEQGSLSRALANLAVHYRRRGKYLTEKLSVFLPTFILVVLGAMPPPCFMHSRFLSQSSTCWVSLPGGKARRSRRG